MSAQCNSGSSTFAPFLFALIITFIALGCDEPTVGPNRRGSIEGVVLDAATSDPITGANITTSPPTQSVLTSDDGTFELTKIPTGNYTVEVTKTDFQPGNVTISVEESRVSSATILLERKDDFGPKKDSLTANVTNWYNARVNHDSTGADSIFAEVEYAVHNVGNVQVQEYEIYFTIDTQEGNFSVEVSGDTLNENQRDLGEFRKYITDKAENVEIKDIYYETAENN